MKASPTRRLPPGKSAGVAAATTTFEQPPDSNSEGGWSEASLPIGEAAVGVLPGHYLRRACCGKG